MEIVPVGATGFCTKSRDDVRRYCGRVCDGRGLWSCPHLTPGRVAAPRCRRHYGWEQNLQIEYSGKSVTRGKAGNSLGSCCLPLRICEPQTHDPVRKHGVS